MEQQYFRSGEVARLVEVSTDLLRHYERIGVLPKPIRTAGGYRRYSAESLDRVRVVQRSLSLGFSLKELARIFAIKDRGGVPCRNVRDLARTKLQQVEQRLADLKILRQQLREMLSEWDGRLAKVPKGHRAGLLDSLRISASAKGPNGYGSKKGFTRK